MLGSNEFLDFVYVGAPRCGSTWLAAVLESHPEVWIPHNKEIHFFNDRLVYPFEYKYPRGFEYYKSYFNKAPKNILLGELSPFYYYDPNAAVRISRAFPNAKIIAFIRQPAEMLYSLYMLLRSREPREQTFERELEKHPQLIDLGFYHRNLLPYFDMFPAENIFVAEYGRFFQDESSSLQQLLAFLGVDPTFNPSQLGKRINQARTDKPSGLGILRGKMIRLLNTKPLIPIKDLLHKMRMNRMDYSGIVKTTQEGQVHKSISDSTRRDLMAQFEPDIARLETMLGIKLDGWRASDSGQS